MGKKQLPYFSRVKEDRRPGISLQERDIDIIEAVKDYRFISSGQLKALFGAAISGRALQRRLKKLYQNGFLNRPKSQLEMRLFDDQRDLIYSLGPRGVKSLARRRDINRNNIKWQVKEAKAIHLRHTLMITKFRIALTLACRRPEERAAERLEGWSNRYRSKKGREPSEITLRAARGRLLREERERYREFRERFRQKEGLDPAVRLKEWRQGKEIRDQAVIRDRETGKRERFPIAPDAYFKLYFPHRTDGKNNDHWFLEADRGTMASGRFVKKMRAYWAYRFGNRGAGEAGGKLDFRDFRVLTVTGDKKRRKLLRGQTKKADRKGKGSDMYWFGCEKDYHLKKPETVLKKIFKTAGGLRLRSILE